MHAAQEIRDAMVRVAALRSRQAEQPQQRDAVRTVKTLQARRFAGTYRDLLAGGPHAAPARFFLEELYSERDFSARDAQFARIAGAMEKFFPAIVIRTAVNLANLHALTEDLDDGVATQWLAAAQDGLPAQRYIAAWRAVG